MWVIMIHRVNIVSAQSNTHTKYEVRSSASKYYGSVKRNDPSALIYILGMTAHVTKQTPSQHTDVLLLTELFTCTRV